MSRPPPSTLRQDRHGKHRRQREFQLGRVADLFHPHSRRVVGVMALVLLSAVIGIVDPLLIQRVFDSGLFLEDASGPISA